MKNKYLPIGTVVKLKGGNKNVMILSYLIFPTGNDEKKVMYDYGACQFPEGVMDSKTGIGFNHSDIEEIIHLGCDNEEYKKLNGILKKHGEALKAEYKKNQFKITEE